jgi:polyhydroxyalkanoate synthesis regulator phasin
MARKTSTDMIRGFKELFGNPKWMEKFEKTVDTQFKTIKGTFDKNLEKATRGLNITTKKDLNLLNSKIRALEKRIEKLEGAKKRPTASKRPKKMEDQSV